MEAGDPDGIVSLECGDILFALWTHAATAARMRTLSKRMDALSAKSPDGMIVCQFILPASAPPDGPARTEALAMLRKHEGNMRRFITIPLGDALWMGLVRSIMRGFFLLIGRSALSSVGATETDAVERIIEKSGPSTPARADIRRAIAELFETAGVSRTRERGSLTGP